jgi:hypothetical protein
MIFLVNKFILSSCYNLCHQILDNTNIIINKLNLLDKHLNNNINLLNMDDKNISIINDKNISVINKNNVLIEYINIIYIILIPILLFCIFYSYINYKSNRKNLNIIL